MSKIEITAPVGSYESLQAAIQAGADSIYFGVKQLNMRAASTQNFDLTDLRKIAHQCHTHNLRAYLAVNSIIYQSDLKIIQKIIIAAKRANIDAIIATDQSVINLANQLKIPVHLSTQLNISNIETVKFYVRFADVMVLARELTLAQIKQINQQIKKEKIVGVSGQLIKTEMFIHGALCMAISGKCYLSLHQHNLSANRGACRQVCRQAYELYDPATREKIVMDNQYLLSPQDLCTIGYLDKIVDSGVSILKIEGRARSPEYVHTVVSCYREALTAIDNKTYSASKVKKWEKRLSSVFNRGLWSGYYLGRKNIEYSTAHGSVATTNKVHVGVVNRYFSRIGIAEIKIEASNLKINDQYLILGKTTGLINGTVQEMRLDDKKIKIAQQKQIISLPIAGLVRQGDKLYKIVQK
ncbi:MAG: collagenase-like protease [Candidatus Komeilibacteria bacterium CG_4_10_14_0_2_um_filter_37_10]|uniref:Collagenase-like protease n=1 Tax=Candidatus Komeilibacteria bacterium CG_4_10_14_0_2_um_filter_37_10 TaxID=1974470 RepID=A0A2M7VGE5_9BACT|nr:MAG: collagenase-like protease [Candidatus Komeilibacteria bacterium CG_4_10_14_0_2_um_filter_37_10]